MHKGPSIAREQPWTESTQTIGGHAQARTWPTSRGLDGSSEVTNALMDTVVPGSGAAVAMPTAMVAGARLPYARPPACTMRTRTGKSIAERRNTKRRKDEGDRPSAGKILLLKTKLSLLDCDRSVSHAQLA